MLDDFIPSLRLTLVTFLLCGLLYPLLMTGMGQVMFPHQANGSLIANPNGGDPLGSSLLGQRFTGPQWFQGRVSSIHDDAKVSGSSNYGPTNRLLIRRVASDIERLKAENPGLGNRSLPADLLTQSGSGLDPHITLAGARLQVPRVARFRGLSETRVMALVNQVVETPDLGILGVPRVNVLRLNLALQAL